MALAPAIPRNMLVQQANGTVLVSWDLSAGADTYTVYRSTNGSTFSSLGTSSTTQYLDSTITLGTQYWYRLTASTSGTESQPTESQSVVPVKAGQMTLGELRLAAQQRADRVGSEFVTTPEWNSYITQSLFELYDLLVTTYEDYYVATPVTFTTDGSTSYALPNGTNYSGAKALYKLIGVDAGINSQSYLTVKKFNFQDRNRYGYPGLIAMRGYQDLRYRIVGDNLEFIPQPASGQVIRLWYVPRMTQPLQDTDIIDGISGWTEYVIVDAAIKALQKEESDITVLAAQKMALIDRINASASNRDAGMPDTITDVSTINGSYGDGGFGGGWD